MSNLGSSLITLIDGYGDPISTIDSYLGVFVNAGQVDSYTFDGYGNPIGSVAGSLNVNLANPITGTFDAYTFDSYGNPIGSSNGALNVNIVSDSDDNFDSYTFDGYGNPIGSVVGSLNVNLTNTFIPSSAGTGDFYRDQILQIVATSPLFTNFSFGFISEGIIIANDDTAAGSRTLEFSFDNFTTIHGVLSKGQQITMDSRRRPAIQLRAAGTNPATRTYRLIVWG